MNTHIKHIDQLVDEMVDLGYHEGEVFAFIHDVVGSKSIAGLTEKEYLSVMDYLRRYITFAKRSKKVLING